MTLRLRIALALTLPLALGGCFTGVEYTPKVTERDVERERIVTTAEDTLLASVGDRPLPQWEKGKRFLVTDNKIRLIFGATASLRDSLAGTVLTFEGASEAPSITGSKVTDLIFSDPGGRQFAYRINAPIKAVADREALSVPFTIQENVIEEARSILQGRHLYILTRTWRDDNDNSVAGRQFIPVTIDSVSAGNDIYPIKVSFTDADGHSARVFLHPGSRHTTPRSFPAFFSFTDPRLRYPNISEAAWTNIINGRVALDMTRAECRLALGTPKEVDRGTDNSFIREVWLYENGVYLVFEDGLLKVFRR